MKFFAFVLLLSAWCQGVWGLSKTVDTPASTETPPLCGLQCIQSVTLATQLCSLTNATCICTNVELNEKISLCVHSNCTVREALLVQSYSKHTCGAPSRDRTALVWVTGVVFLVLGLLAFVLRVMARLCLGGQSWGPDDWVMCIAVLFYWDELLYLGALPITKISILLFYLKIFPKREIRIGCWVLIGLNVAYFITFELISIFQCRPIDGAWRAWDKEYPAKCNNINIQGWAAAIINILLDLATLILPLKELYNLSLSTKKKLMVILMFSVGFFVTIVSVVRLHSLASYATTSNATQDYVEVGYWSTIEVPVGVICASMPAIRSLFSLVFPKVFGTTQRGKSNYANLSSQQKDLSNSQKVSSKGSSKPAIRVLKEFTVRSRHRDDVSYVEHELTAGPFTDPSSRPSSEKKPITPHESV
ncbi:CFEM domain-containing protein [Colletotrichum scovillei]|uniref:CFEM domain-containing protein n=1 Tax=Colletotrichum scovillei TaxID=1209932 RepID=A0A9P7R4L0_9PEZI|nr:CFEM domain-containing protein [Colletotrichum scovillei]KAG7069150.1 CFEM domain-containing protein [Colletotrichum scovillei]KAG7073103.1 CFEM domain-containing protein [Colletotrichum scovillei]